MSNNVIEVNGFKITPELVDAIKRHLMPMADDVEEIKSDLFHVQSAMLYAIASDEDINPNLRRLTDGLFSFHQFLDELSTLRKNGKC